MASDRIRGDKIRKTVILDTSALLSFFEFSVDWEKELARLLDAYEIAVPEAVLQELALLSSKGGEKRQKANAALTYASRYKTVETKATHADEAVVESVKKVQGIVFTNDTALRHRLQKEHIPVLLLRGRKKLALEE
ncbi:MAG TPA: PIN domain-containing protein [Candidatus Thermoplasmatota archaeon]|nr:PIN domain-containing protein [Candidatus Thermoplasmatota archaeon]